ncbi:carboxy-S-adenosyl-L-methionine synthase CmoA [Halobacteriovorax sp. GB3]|uniref:carboxy-S-adenosyl-L-methionine synthase CmoA n=1 Tax=Halobacteriovorax sp. GB3 TaxID=2719615 RepID=UPI00235E6ED0|nr:carboxy-S-adenosyl-L-methionine synthase CmoA [Halobacteriovorax sp. GB3]MDD0851934.1 carboxy-S-adenosyl-L-methionine synthase CmoA [Halobacteriovorax sp. GB3]
MSRDEVFRTKLRTIKGFEFNQQVADVFDDMVSRSIPFYDEIHRIILDLIDRGLKNKGKIYDLGCSTGTTFALIDGHLKSKNEQTPKYFGIDMSAPMLEKAKTKLEKHGVENFELRDEDVCETEISDASMVVMNYTLQFIEKSQRLELLKKIYNNLEEGGLFVLSEKLLCREEGINDLITDLYYDFKRRNGYSELEISQKREALENVLVPLSPDEQLQLLKDAGFKKVDIIFRWYNFASYVGIK